MEYPISPDKEDKDVPLDLRQSRGFMQKCSHNAKNNASEKFALCLSPFVQKKSNTSPIVKINILSQTIGLNLRRLLDEQGIGYGDFADKIGMPKSYLSEVMNGKRRFNTTHIDAILSELKCTPDDLMGDGAEDEARKTARRAEILMRDSTNYIDIFKVILDGAETKAQADKDKS